MKCQKCNSEIAEDSSYCSNCGASISRNSSISNSSQITNVNNSYGIAVIALGIIACILFFVSASQIGSSAKDMITIRSQSGTSVAEAYYQDVGRALKGFAMFARAIGISILSITVYLGGKSIKGK